MADLVIRGAAVVDGTGAPGVRRDAGIAVHACYLVPQGSVRMLAAGWEQRPVTAAELDRMRSLVAGTPVIADGRHTGALPGRSLRRTREGVTR